MTSLSETAKRQKRPISFSGMNVDQVKSQLTSQLEEKEKLLSKVGTSQISRNALIKQSDVIRKELARLNHYSQEEELPDEIRSKLEDLANEFQYLKSSKSVLDDSAGTKLSPLLPPPPTNSSPTKQRNKTSNGNRRNPDIEFATEIGQGLLIEVRKLQTALQEKDEIIKQLELAKADNERNQETAQRHLKQRDEIEERLKEEVWNLEVANQELRTHLSESNQSVAKHNSDYSRLAKQLKIQSEQIDIMKAQEEKSASVIEAMKARHEQETYHLRRHAATAQRENSQVQKQVEALNTELKIVKAKLAIKLASSSRTAEENASSDSVKELSDENDSENDQNKTTAPPATTLNANRNQQVLETETLKQSLAHAHRIISNLRSSYHKEKLEKFELKKMLSDSQENIEQMRKEMSSWNSNNTISVGSNNGTRNSTKVNGKKKSAAKKRRGGVARQPRGLCLNESDSDQQSTKTDEEEEELLGSNGYDSIDEDNGLDQHFTNYGNSFDGGMLDFNNGNGFSSVAMKPLSSELEAKIQMVDAGINTDPMDFATSLCAHGLAQNVTSPSSPSSLLVGESASLIKQGNDHKRVTPFVVPQKQEQESYDQEVICQNGDAQLVTDQQTSEVDNNKQVDAFPSLTSNINNSASHNNTRVVTEEYMQEQLSMALIKERKIIAERAGPILSPEQIDTLLAPSLPTNVSASEIVRSPIDTNKPIEPMVPQNQVDKLIETAIKKEVAGMVPKIEVEKLIQDAVTLEQEKFASLNLIPKTEAENMVQEAIKYEQGKVISLSLIPKTEAEKLVHEAIVSEQEKTAALNLIPKVEAEKMVEEITKKLKEDADILVEETRMSLSSQHKADQEEIFRDMIPKKEAEAMTLAAVALANKEIQDEITSFKNLATPVSTEKMFSKKEVDKLVQKATENEKLKIQEALDKQKMDIEAAASLAHKKELDANLEKQKMEMDAVKMTELEQHTSSLEAIKQAELEQHIAILEASKQDELEKRLAELEVLKQLEYNKLKEEIKAENLVALESQRKEIELIKCEEFEKQKQEITIAAQAEFEKQKLEIEAGVRAESEKKVAEVEASKKSELEELNASKLAELAVLSKTIENYKKEYDEINQRMVTMLTKDSADVLVKRAIADTLEKAEKNQAEILAGMISREYALVMVKDEVAKALDAERKEVSQREEAEAIEMISKAEAEALAKVAAADAIVKERQALAAREKELITKEEAEALATTAAREAVDKERSESALVLAKERRLLRDKEEQLITKEEAENKAKEAVRLALLEKENKAPELTTTSHLNIASSGSNLSESTRYLNNIEESSSLKQNLPNNAIERSVSTSRLAPPTLNVSPAPSISTPASSSSRKLRLSSSVSSLRLGSGRKENNIQKNQRPSIDSTTPSGLSFGSFRILENSKYGSTRLQSKSSISLRELSNKQNSVTSISTMSSDEGHHNQMRTPLPMSSEDSFPGFSNTGGTDMYVISAITQTMIGEWMSKHTRRYVGSGISENKHQRFFWVHPYTKILYWSSIQPGAEGNTAKTKSAFIESVLSVPSGDNTGASSPMSLLIRTPKRSLKLTAPNMERHELWLKSLSYLLGRPNDSTSQLIEEPRLTTESSSAIENAGHPQTSTINSKASDRSIPHHVHDIAQYDSDDSDDLINIRQCCDGKHDLSTLSKNNHHHS